VFAVIGCKCEELALKPGTGACVYHIPRTPQLQNFPLDLAHLVLSFASSVQLLVMEGYQEE